MRPIAAGTSLIDLEFEGRQGVIATAVLQGPSGVALVDPGPASTLPMLRRALASAGLTLNEVTDLVLTHIHLDHAGACGSLVEQHPALRVHVHERGAPHMVDPSRLVASASRLYGPENMTRLWGEVRPVPRAALRPLKGGEDVDVGGQRLHVEYTPGHACHHVSYFSASTGLAFVGDTAGIKLSELGVVLPPTPPPDIDLEAWHASLDLIERQEPAGLFVTHFGPYSPPAVLLGECRRRLATLAALARRLLDREGTDADREQWFVEQVRDDVWGHGDGATVEAYDAAGRIDLSWRGLARYWRRANRV